MAEPIVLPTHWRFKNLTGRRFGRLTVIEFAGTRAPRKYQWQCECECGGKCVVAGGRLTSHARPTKSCGCLRKTAGADVNRTHGRSYTPEYNSWASMNQRCHDPNAGHYSRYGGRGITVCDEWRHSFQSFFEHVGAKPSPSHSIDRIDNSRGYCPGNVRWATLGEQARNKRNTVVLTFKGRTQPLIDWASELGINPSTLKRRIRSYKWTIERALTESVAARKKGVT